MQYKKGIFVTIEQIRQFIAIVETGSINKAAKTLYLSQPNLTTSLKNLENELGVSLFERTQRGMLLTKDGRYFFSVVKPLYQQYSSLPEMFHVGKRGRPVSFCISNSYFSYVSTIYCETVERFWKDECYFNYREVNPFEVYEDVVQQHSDIGVLYFSRMTRNALLKYIKSNDVEYTRLVDCQFIISCGPNHPLAAADEDSLGVEVLSQYPVVNYDSFQHNFGMWGNSVFSKLDIPHNIVVNSRSTLHYLLNHTEAIKVGFCAKDNVSALKSQFKKIQLSDADLSMEVGWICRTGYQHNEISQYFVDRLADHFTEC